MNLALVDTIGYNYKPDIIYMGSFKKNTMDHKSVAVGGLIQSCVYFIVV